MAREATPPVAGGASVAITTLMFRNMPRKHGKNDLLSAMEQHVDMSTVDFMHLPRDWKANCSTGYAFVNFVDAASASAAMVRMRGLLWPKDGRAREIVIRPAMVQGLVANIRNYMNKDTEPDFDHCPWVFIEGEPVPLHVALREVQQMQARDAGDIGQGLALEFGLRAPQGGPAPDCISPPPYPSSFAEDLVPENLTSSAHQHVQQVKARDAASIGQGLEFELWPSAPPSGWASGGIPPPPVPSSFAENLVPENPMSGLSELASGANASFVRRDVVLDQRAPSSGGVTSSPAVGQALKQWQDPAQRSSEGMVAGIPVCSPPRELHQQYQMQTTPENCKTSSSDHSHSVSIGGSVSCDVLFEDYSPWPLGATSSAAATRLDTPRRDALLRSPKYAAARLQVTSLLQCLKQRGAF